MRFTLLDISMPILVAVGFVVIGWASIRPIYAGGGLPGHMKKGLFYGFFFVLGMGYLMMFASGFNLPHPLLFTAIGAWGILLASIGLWRYRRSQIRAAPGIQRRPVSAVLGEGIPALALMICVVGAAVEWESVFEGRGHWWVGVFWLTGVAVCILAARRNRRSTVIIVLRGTLALLIIGAIAQRTATALGAAAIFGLGLLLLEKFWHGSGHRRDQVLRNSTGHG